MFFFFLAVDIIALANSKVGRKPNGNKRKCGFWGDNVEPLLNVYLFYKPQFDMFPRQALQLWKKVSASLWYYHDLDFSHLQCRDKIQKLTDYFLNNIMTTPSGQDGTSAYKYFPQMVKIADVVLTESNTSSQPSSSSLSDNDFDDNEDEWHPIPASMGKIIFYTTVVAFGILIINAL